MRLSQLSTAQRFAAGCGCVILLAFGVGAAMLVWLGARTGGRFQRELAEAPPGWTDSIRAMARLPDLAGLLPARDQPGDGSAAAHDSGFAWGRPSIEGPYRALMNPERPATADDSAAWQSIRADTTLDRFVRAADMQYWNATERVLAASGGVARSNALALPVSDYRDIRNATRALVIRGVLRLGRGDREGARRDFAGATGLGERLARREPTTLGLFVGRAALSTAMRGWERYAIASRDSALAARARAVQAWATGQPGRYTSLIIAAPDSGLLIAADTSLSLGMRSDALRNVLAGWIVRPRGFLIGPPRRVEHALRALAQSSDPDFAALAGMTATTAERMHLFAIAGLMREAERR